ncbi:MAG: endolytic transglycosylase MltG [Lachnospiraceae bacterium]|nr:endolytic transglycosylase MltG [Lachnospiraceae bacterium]
MSLNKILFAFIKIAFSVMVVLFVIFGTLELCRMGYDYGYRLFTETAVDVAPGEDVLVLVEPGTSGYALAKKLEEKGLVRDAKLFYFQLKLSAYSKSIEAGTYTLNTSMTPKEMMIAMSPGEQETQTTEAPEAAGE